MFRITQNVPLLSLGIYFLHAFSPPPVLTVLRPTSIFHSLILPTGSQLVYLDLYFILFIYLFIFNYVFLLLLFVLHKNLGDCSFKTHHSVTYYRRLQEENSLVGLSRAAISARPLNLHKPTKLLPFSATRGGKRKWNGF